MSKIYGIPVATPINPSSLGGSVDDTLTKSGQAADAAAVGDKMATKADVSTVAGLSEEIGVERSRITNLAALKDGSTTGDAELLDMHIGHFGESYGNAGEAVRGQVGYAVTESASLAEDTKLNTQLETLTNGRFFKIHTDMMHQVSVLKDPNKDGNIVVDGTEAGSAYIKCPKYVCVYFPDSAARCRLYFYSLVDGKYVPRWDIIDETASTGGKNYLNNTHCGTHLLEMPDENVYLTFSQKVGKCELYGWDGEMFGMPMSAECGYPKTDGTTTTLYSGGSFGVTIPGSAKFIVSSATFSAIIGYRDKKAYNLSSYNLQFFKFPEGYDYFRVRVLGSTTRSGDVSDILSVVVDTQSERPSGRAVQIIKNCKNVCSLSWKPVDNVLVKGKDGDSFKTGVTYNGIPYGSEWQKAHYVGWHISPHTFLNAVNDSESIFYNEKVAGEGIDGPYYGLVCSAFTTLCAGWPYPQTNKGMLYDPNVILTFSNKPAIGDVYMELGHSVIPERVDHMDGSLAVSAYECTYPLSSRTTRYNNVLVGDGFLGTYPVAAGYSYYNDYGYVAHHIGAVKDADLRKMANAPYIGMTEEDLTIVNGSARPYKGDKSVYTSAEEVKINIKDASATTLHLMKDGGSVQSITINGATQIDVKNYLSGDGIYYVYTNVSETKESFEYHTVEAIQCTWNSGVPKFNSDGCWYVMFSMSGDPRTGDKSGVTAQLPADDYSYMTKNGATIASVYSVFRKGTYGAYAVPLENRGNPQNN